MSLYRASHGEWPPLPTEKASIPPEQVDVGAGTTAGMVGQDAALPLVLSDVTGLASADISGTKYTDANGDGSTAGDSGLGGVTIFIDRDGSGTLTAGDASTVTAADGSFRLEMEQIVPNFGQPHAHLAYDDSAFETVFLRPLLKSARDTSLTTEFILAPA